MSNRWEKSLITGGTLAIEGHSVRLQLASSPDALHPAHDVSWWSTERIVRFLSATAVGGFPSWEATELRARVANRVASPWVTITVHGAASLEAYAAECERLRTCHPEQGWQDAVQIDHASSGQLKVRKACETRWTWAGSSRKGSDCRLTFHDDDRDAVLLAYGAIVHLARYKGPLSRPNPDTVVVVQKNGDDSHDCKPLRDALGVETQLQMLGLGWPLPEGDAWCPIGDAIAPPRVVVSSRALVHVIDF